MINNYTTLNSSVTTGFKKTWKEKMLFLVFLVLFSVFGVQAQISVTVDNPANTTPNLAAGYPNLAAALTDLNAVTAMSGPITLTLTGSETAPATGFTIGSATLNPVLSATNTVTLLASGTVTINAGVGTATPTSAAPDGILKLLGADYVTLNGITFTDGNTTNPATMEYGVALFKRAAGDGCNNNTIVNCIFNMQRVNNASATAPMVEGSVGILVINSTATTATTSLTPTNGGTLATNGTNSNNRFYTNTINSGNYGIVFSGFSTSTGAGPTPNPATFIGDLGNDVGGTASGTGNSILNFGGAASATNPSAGIRANNQWSINIQYNTVNNNTGSGVNHVSTLRGIFAQSGTSANATISNNNVTLQGGGTTSALTAIDNGIGSTAASNTINILSNTIRLAYATATSAAVVGINNSSSATTVNINSNNIQRIPGTVISTTSTSSYMIEGQSPGTLNMNNNTIANFELTNATGTFRGLKAVTPSVAWNCTGNLIENISITNLTSTAGIDAIYDFSSAQNINISNNIIRNLSTPTTGTLNGVYIFTSSGTLKTCSNNQVYNFSTTPGGAGGASMYGLRWSVGPLVLSGNTVYALNSNAGTSPTINGLLYGGTGNSDIYNNKVYDLSSGGSNPSLSGLVVSSGATNTVYNNIIGDLRTPAANAGNPLMGINISGGTTANVYFNTVYLNGSSTGALFGSSAISVSTSPTVNLRNNIFVNNSSVNGAAFAAAYRRSSTTLTSYAGTSNNNYFFSSNPTHVYYDGTLNRDFPAFRTLLADARDSSSFTSAGIPAFLSTSGSSANFLHIDATVGTQIESGGAAIAGITTDFDGDTRNASTPDIGADEFAGTSPAPVLSAFTISPSGNLCVATPRDVSVTATSPSGSILSVTLNYAFNGVSQAPIAMTNTFGNVWSATIPAATPSNATVTWSVAAINTPLLLTTSSSSGITYKDDPLFYNSVVITPANPQICGGSGSITLNSAFSTNTSPIGAGSTTSSGTGVSFFPGAWGGAKTQYIIRASELTAAGFSAGTFNSLSFEVTSGTPQAFDGFRVQLGHTTATSMTTTFLTDPLTQVYYGTGVDDSFTPVSGLNTLTFGTGAGSASSFVWDGTSNLLINICWSSVPNATTSNAITMKSDETGFTCSAYERSDSITPAAQCALATGDGTATARAQFRFGYTAAAPQSVSWSDGSGSVGNTASITVSPTVNTTYTATYLTAGGCSKTSSPVTVQITTTPTTPTAANSVQCGPGVPTASVTSTSGLPTPTFKWYADNSTTTALQSGTSNTFTSSVSETRTFFVSEANGVCESPRVQVTVTVNTPPTLNATGTTIFCGVGGSGTLTATSDDPNMTFVWTSLNPATGTVDSSVNGVLNYTVTATTLFRLVGTPVSNPLCSPITKDFSVSVFPLPTTILTAPDGVCPGSSATITSDLATGSFQSVSIAHAPLAAPVSATTLVTGGVATPFPATFPGNSFSALDDGGWADIPMGFNFNFFGTSYNKINVGTNGTLQFGTFNANGDTAPRGLSDFVFTSLPSTTEPFNLVAVLAMDNDLQGADGGTVRYWTEGTAPNRKFIVSYEAVKRFASTTYSTAQAVFYETTGVIEVHVTGSTNSNANKLVGVNNGNGTIGTLAYASGTVVSTNPQNPITNPFAYRFTPPYNYNTTWSYQNSTTGGGFVTLGTPNTLNGFNQTVTPTETTLYRLLYTNTTTGCSNLPGSADVLLTVLGTTAPNSVAVSSVPALCLGTGSATLSLTGAVNSIGSTTGLTYQWQVSTGGGAFTNVASAGTSATYTATPTTTSTYQCLVTACGGTAVASSPVTVTVNTPGTISIPANYAVCTGGSTVLTATPVTGTMNSYVWSPETDLSLPIDGASVTVTPTATRSYTVYGIDSNSCQTPSVSTTVTVNPYPAAVAVTANAALPFANNTICHGAIVELTASGGGTTPTYVWTTNPVTPLYTDSAATNLYTTGNFAVLYAKPTVATRFTATVTELNCATPGYVDVGVTPLPVFTVAPITICKGSVGTLTVTSAQDNTYTWSPAGVGGATSGPSLQVDPLVTSVYNVTATSNTTTPACSTALTPVTVTVSDPGAIVTQPVNSIASTGNGTTFTVAGTAGVTYGYQWQIRTSASPAPDGTWANLATSANYTGVNTPTLNVLLAGSGTAVNNARYRCILTPPSPCAVLTSAVALLTVSTTGIVSGPDNLTVCLPTSTAQFTVVTNGTEPFNAQWLVNAAGGTPTTSLNLYNQATATYTGPNTTLVPGLTFEHPIDVGTGLRNIKVLTISGINSTAFNNLKLRVTLNNFLQSPIATLNVSDPVVITTDVSTTPVKVCKVTTVTNLSIATTGTVAGVEWKYSTSANGTYNSLVANTPAGTTYANANTNTLSVTTTAATPVGSYFYKAFVTAAGSGPGKCPDVTSQAAQIQVVSPTITITPSSTVYCSPGTGVTLTASGSDTGNYSWTSLPIGFTSTNAAVTVTPSVATTYNVLGTDSNGCTNTASQMITVGASIVATATASLPAVCPSTTIDLFGSAGLAVPYSGPTGVGSYTFENTTAPFNTIVGGAGTTALTLLSSSSTATTDDGISSAQTLPFTFNYGGNNFTGFKMSTNGWITFDTAATSTTNYASLNGSVNNIIAAFSRDLDSNNSATATYHVQTSGAVGSRITKIEWANIKAFSTLNNPATGNVQIWLYEGTNRVEIRYGIFTTSSGRTSSTTCNVGLRGASTAAANVRSLSVATGGSWASPTLGTSSTATVALGTFAAPILPDAGRLYRFTPPGIDTNTYTYAWTSTPAGVNATTKNTTATPTVNTTYNLVVTSQTGCSAQASVAVNVDSTPPSIGTHPLTQTLCQGVTATLTVAATSATPLTYQWYKGATMLTNGGSISGATSATLTITGAVPADSGSYSVTVSNCSSVTSNTAVLTINPLPTATIAGTTNVCLNGASPVVTFTGANGTAPYTFTYKLNGGADQTIVSSGNTATINVLTDTAGTSSYSLVSVQDSSSTTCSNPQTGSATVIVNPLPVAPVLSSNSPVCEGSALNLTSTVAPLSGYTMNSNSGVAFIDINATGTSIGTISDDSKTTVTFPSFIFNGVAYTTGTVLNNGALVLGSAAVATGFINLNTALPTSSFGGSNAVIVPMWDDYFPAVAAPLASIKSQVIGNKYILQWTDEAQFDIRTDAGRITFQIQLDLVTGQIHFVYSDVLFENATYNNGVNATVGLNYSTTAGLQYSFNTASLNNGQSITFTPSTYSFAWTGPNSFSSAVQNPSIAGATPAASGAYTLEITDGNGCKNNATTNATVHPTPTAVAPANQGYFNGLATAAIPLSGTPSGVTFDITGGSSVGLADATGLTQIPSFIPVTGTATVTITPKANGCTGSSVSYNIVVSAVNANPIANQEYCEGVTTSAIPLSHTPTALTGVTYTILGGASVGLADVSGVTAIPSFVAIPGTATITVIPQYGGVSGGAVTGTILVNPLPTATIAGTTAVCRNDAAPTVTFTGANGTAPYTFSYTLNGGSIQNITSSGNTATIAQPTGTAGTFTYTLVSVKDSSSTTCSNAQSGTATIVVHPTPTVAPVANQSYYSGFATAAIPLTGTPSGVTFNISGGAASGLADVNGVTAIPSFIPTTTPSTVTITPVANGCVGVPVTYQIAFNPVVVNISSNVCGSVNNGLNNQINCTQVSVPGYTTTGYMFEVTNTATGEVAVVFSSQHHFKLTDSNNYAYGTTFTIRVAAVLNGQVQGYFGSTCSLTTASVQTSRVVTAQCGSTLVFINSTINANSVSSTNLYRFRVALASAPTVTYLVERSVPNFKLTDVVGLPLLYNTEYLVDVQIRVKLAGFEAWSQYGVRCSIFTPAAPETSLVNSQCEDYAVPSSTSPISAIAFPGATAYRFRLTGYDGNGDVNYQQAVTNAGPSFTLSQFSGLTPGATYTVAVAMELFGTFTDYAKDCSIVVPLIGKQAIVEPFKATAYPNPFADNFMIDVKTTSDSVISIKVYDMVGRLVEQKTATVAQLETSPIGNNYPSGVYNVVVTQDETVQTVRVVKR